MDAFYEYLCALWPHWIWFMTGGPFVAERITKQFWPRYDAWAMRFISPNVWLRVGFSAAVVGMFIASFLAFDDERAFLQKANGQLAGLSGQVHRKLDKQQKSRLVAAFANKQKEFPILVVSSVSGLEAERYAYDFTKLFKDQKFNVQTISDALPEDDTDVGVMVGFISPDHLSQTDKDFLGAISAAKIPIKVVRLLAEPGSGLDFDLFIGPPAL